MFLLNMQELCIVNGGGSCLCNLVAILNSDDYYGGGCSSNNNHCGEGTRFSFSESYNIPTAEMCAKKCCSVGGTKRIDGHKNLWNVLSSGNYVWDKNTYDC